MWVCGFFSVSAWHSAVFCSMDSSLLRRFWYHFKKSPLVIPCALSSLNPCYTSLELLGLSFLLPWLFLHFLAFILKSKIIFHLPCFKFNMKVKSESEVAQSCPTLCDPMDGSLPGSSIHGVFQARILEWFAISFSRGSSQPRDRTQVSCTMGRLFTVWDTREAQFNMEGSLIWSNTKDVLEK